MAIFFKFTIYVGGGDAIVITRSGVQKTQLHHCTHVPILTTLVTKQQWQAFLSYSSVQ